MEALGDNAIVLIVAILGAGGIGATFREIVGVFVKLFGGMSAREDKRKIDIVAERDAAIHERDKEAMSRRALEEAYSVLRRKMIEEGLGDKIPQWPDYDQHADGSRDSGHTAR